MEELRLKHKKVADEIGECCLSCMDVFEALEEGDCMCIGLDIERPEAAIADPSRLVIKRIVPTFATSESFLQSAQWKLSQGDQAAVDDHGGFKDGKEAPVDGGGPQLMMGLGNENITGIMPLHLFPQHWQVARRKVAPVFGFMCTLDIMGYSQEQLNTVPFLVLVKALQDVKKNPSESNRRVLRLIE